MVAHLHRRALQQLVLLLLAAASAAAASSDDEDARAALAVDEQCAPDAAGDCALSAVQLRGQKVIGAEEGHGIGSCRHYGCGGFAYSQSCQCNSNCHHYGNCCSDYGATCAASARGSCLEYGCVEYTRSHHCQCNEKCTKYGNCCEDYAAACAKSTPSPEPDVPPAPGLSPGEPVGHIYGHPDPSADYPTYDGFTLVLAEEFDTPLHLDADPIWTWSDGGLIEGQVRFVKEAIQFEDGKMKVVVSNTLHVPVQPCSNAEGNDILHKNFTSGELRSRHNMFRYGRYEASIKAPSVQPGQTSVNGNYIATMFVFRGAKYKHWREIDFEITGNSPSAVTTNVLSADNTDKWKQSIAEDMTHTVSVNVRADFHTYAFEWLPDSITWFIDGKVLRKKVGGALKVPDLSGKIMMNLWMFDDRALFGGPEIQNNRYPLYSEYDWFRFYKWNGDTHYPCPGMSTSCLTADDQYLSSNNPCDGIPQVGTIYGKAPCVATCR